MAASFVPTFTRTGLAAVRVARGNGLSATVVALAVGSGVAASGGGWAGYTPDGNEVALKGEFSRVPILSATPIGSAAGTDPIGFRVVAEIPRLAPGSSALPVMEFGVVLDDGNLLCLWSAASGAVDVLGSITANSAFDVAFDLYFTALPPGSITVQVVAAETIPDFLAPLFQLLRGVARNATREMDARHRLARRGIRS